MNSLRFDEVVVASCVSSLKFFYLNSLSTMKSRFFDRDIEFTQMKKALRRKKKKEKCFVIYDFFDFDKTRFVFEFIDKKVKNYEYII